MAITEVGAGSQRATVAGSSGEDFTTVAFPGNVTAGNLLICAGAVFQAVAPASIAVTDSQATSYTVLSSAVGVNTRVFLAYGVAGGSGANTVTINPDGTGNFISAAIDEFAGTHTAPLDVDAGVNIATSTTPTIDITTGTNDALIVGVVDLRYGGGTHTITPGGSYTQIGEAENADFNMTYNAVFRVVTTPQLYTVDWVTSDSVEWGAYAASFKPTAIVAATSAAAAGIFRVKRTRWG